jgi:hypothetical protein
MGTALTGGMASSTVTPDADPSAAPPVPIQMDPDAQQEEVGNEDEEKLHCCSWLWSS